LKTENPRIVIFTDLDGTLLNEQYSFEDVKPAIDLLLNMRIPIVLCSSKTRAEIEYYQSQLGVFHPFIAENGAAIFIPKGYSELRDYITKQIDKYSVIELGKPYSIIREKFELARKKCGCEVRGFGDMTVKELAAETGLSLRLAELAKRREYSEPFVFKAKPNEDFFQFIKGEELHYIFGGKYYCLLGDHNKGKAMSILKRLYAEKSEKLLTIGVGNQANDFEMLNLVDKPFFVYSSDSLKHVWERIVDFVHQFSSELASDRAWICLRRPI
jgi:mannosyl-3-phosphoglycerate phosphatase